MTSDDRPDDDRMKKMKEYIKLQKEEDIIVMADKVVYSQQPYWCDCDMRQLSLSVLHPRMYYSYDTPRRYPLLVFFCGGGFQKTQRNVWMPELVYFAKHGFVVASVDYSVLPYTRFPDCIIDAKAAVRYLKANADRFGIDPARTAVMGESAGGYIAAFLGLTSGMGDYDKGDYPDVSSTVQAVIANYPVIDVQELKNSSAVNKIRVDTESYPELCGFVGDQCCPVCIFHGNRDDQVPYDQSERFYDALIRNGIPAQLTIVEDANHGDSLFIQPEIKERAVQFLKRYLA